MKLKEILFFVFSTAPLCLFLSLPSFLSAQTISISEIEIVGNQRIEVDTIRSYISLSPGNVFEADEINAAYQRVLKSGLFESVDFKEIDLFDDYLDLIAFDMINICRYSNNSGARIIT